MPKRQSDIVLTKENYESDLVHTDPGTWKADTKVLSDRPILKARRRNNRPIPENFNSDMNSSVVSTPAASQPIPSMFKSSPMSGMFSKVAAPHQVNQTPTLGANASKVNANNYQEPKPTFNSTELAEYQVSMARFDSKLKKLNQNLLEAVEKSIKSGKLVILSPILLKYDVYLKEMRKEANLDENNCLLSSFVSQLAGYSSDSQALSAYETSVHQYADSISSSSAASSSNSATTISSDLANTANTVATSAADAVKDNAALPIFGNISSPPQFGLASSGQTNVFGNTSTFSSADSMPTKQPVFGNSSISTEGGCKDPTDKPKVNVFGNSSSSPFSSASADQDNGAAGMKTASFGSNAPVVNFASQVKTSNSAAPEVSSSSSSTTLTTNTTDIPAGLAFPAFKFNAQPLPKQAPAPVVPNPFAGKSFPSFGGSTAVPTSSAEVKPTTADTPAASAKAFPTFNLPAVSAPASTTAPASFCFGAPAPAAASSGTAEPKEKEIAYVPPVATYTEVVEDDAFYTTKAKLYYKKDGKFVDRGVGSLYLKKTDKGGVLLLRAATNLGSILLNIKLAKSLPIARSGNRDITFICVPNPLFDPKNKDAQNILLRVKNADAADLLFEKINEAKNM